MVIDASIAGKWILTDESGSDKAFDLLDKHISGVEEIIVPDILPYEIANTLVTKSKISLYKTTLSLTKIYEFHLQIYHPGEEYVKEAAKWAKKYKTSVYDMLYAIVAKVHKTNLITADKQFIKQTGFKFVKLL